MSENQANANPGNEPGVQGESSHGATNDDTAVNPAPSPPPAPGYAHESTAQQPVYQYPWQPQQHWVPPQEKKGGGARVAVATVAAAVIAMGAGIGGVFVGKSINDDASGGTSNVQTITNTGPIVDRSSLADIAAKLQPSVVVISTGSGEGSGVVISADGYIVTNNHVVASARDSVDVTFNSGKKVDGDVVGTDPRTDLAVIKVNESNLAFAEWDDSNSVQVGDTVLAIGSPLGLQGSVTAGIVSALHRTITVGDDQGQQGTTIGDAIQTDAPINPGNSGGALVNTSGKVVGINSAIATSGQGSNGNIGVGFAISANKAKSVADQLIKGGKVSHPYLGVNVTAAESGGALVRSVAAGSPAEKAGVQAGDVITKVDGRAIAGSEDLIGAVQGGTVGGTMQLTILRSGSERAISATLAEAPN